MGRGTCIVINPSAGSYVGDAVIRRFASTREDVALRACRRPGHAYELAARARLDGFALVAAAGGDGTINEVARALVEDPESPALGVLPLGTGNDLARSLAVPLDIDAALEALCEGRSRRIDVIHVAPDGEAPRIAVNACVGGVGPEPPDPRAKRFWGSLAYVDAGMRSFVRPERHELRIHWEDGRAERMTDVLAMIVANGRTAGGGQPAAPGASLEDGLLDVVVVQQGTALEMAELLARFVLGDMLPSPLVTCRRARALRVESRPGLWFSVDGERVCDRPITFGVAPRALEAVVGPGYTATAPLAAPEALAYA